MIGGGLGACARAWITQQSKHYLKIDFPIATLFVNLLGCFLIGYTASIAHEHHWFSLFVVTGFLGGLTTFSTMSLELVQMLLEKIKSLNLYFILCFSLSLAFYYVYSAINYKDTNE